MLRRALLATALCAACSVKGDFGDTRFRCDVSERCPASYTCILGVCRTGRDPALDRWVDGPPIPGRDYNHPHTAFVGDTLYLIGGFDTTTGNETADVHIAHFVDGVLGPWAPTTSLPAPRALGDVVTIGDRIYLVGGADEGAASVPQVYMGTVSATGEIASWMQVPSLPSGVRGHCAVTANGYIYVVGGGGPAGLERVATVYFTKVTAAGDLVGWQLTEPLPVARANLGCTATGGHIYAIGGDDLNDVPYSDVYVAALDPDTGAVGSWEPTTSLLAARKNVAVVDDGAVIYLVGGAGAGTSTDQVLHNRIGVDGVLDVWENNLPLPAPRFRHSAVLTATGQLFVLGGATTPTSVIFASRVAP